MIQRASDPTISRPGWRPAVSEVKDVTPAHQSPHGGRAWPFISRWVDQGSDPQRKPRSPINDCGS